MAAGTRSGNLARKRQAILDGAVSVFIDRGLEGASMDEVARVAGASKRTVYNHFGSKESLFAAVVDEFLALRDQIKPVRYAPDRPLADQLVAFARAELFLVDDARRRGLSKLLAQVFLANPPLGAATRGRFDPHAPLIAWLQAAQADGRLTVPRPQLAARIFYGMVEGCLTWGAVFSDGATLAAADEVIAEIVTVFLSRYAA